MTLNTRTLDVQTLKAKATTSPYSYLIASIAGLAGFWVARKVLRHGLFASVMEASTVSASTLGALHRAGAPISELSA